MLKAGRKINVLARLYKLSKRCIYESFIHSQFSYCTAVWHLCNVTDIRKMEKLQNRPLKCIYKNVHAS